VFVALGTIVLEPFVGDFQDKLFDESQFFFEDQRGKCPMIIFTHIHISSVDVELHHRSKRSATFARLTLVD
jgi:hypothetical protein